MQFGNPLVAASQFASGQVDTLFFGNANTGGISTTIPVQALNPYKALRIQVTFATATSIYALCAQAGNITYPAEYSGAFSLGPTIAALAMPEQWVTIGMANNTGDIIQVVVFFTIAPPANTGIIIQGLTDTLPFNIRGDGRNYPIGQQLKFASQTGAGSSNVFPAPGTQYRWLISGAQDSVSGAPAGTAFQCTVNGFFQNLTTYPGAAGQQIAPIPPQGLLCDPNTAIVLTSVAGVNRNAVCIADQVAA